MEWIENVEEARMYVEETMKDQLDTEEIGAQMDAEKEHEDLFCDKEGCEEDPVYFHLNPQELLEQNCFDNLGPKLCKRLELEDYQILEKKTQQLDADQMMVLTKAIEFAKGLRKSAKPPNIAPEAPKLVVTGGAGSGKSTIIEAVAQWVHRILQKPGDDPESPYVVKTATTGAASTLIGGVTLHSAMGFDFSNKHVSLTDKKRELRRNQLHNTKVLIVDEFSMLTPDLLYRLDLALREIKANNREYGSCMLILLGDLCQVNSFYSIC